MLAIADINPQLCYYSIDINSTVSSKLEGVNASCDAIIHWLGWVSG